MRDVLHLPHHVQFAQAAGARRAVKRAGFVQPLLGRNQFQISLRERGATAVFTPPLISLALTRLSEQPLHRYIGTCGAASRMNYPGSRASFSAAQRRLFSNSGASLSAMQPVRASSEPDRLWIFASPALGEAGRQAG